MRVNVTHIMWMKGNNTNMQMRLREGIYKYVDNVMIRNYKMMRIRIIMWIRLCYGMIRIYADEIMIMDNTNMWMVL